MLHPQNARLAQLLVNHSCKVEPGDNVLIQASDTPLEFVECLINAVYEAKGNPVLSLDFNHLRRAILAGASKESLKVIRETELYQMKQMDAFIGVRGLVNTKELGDLPGEKNQLWITEVNEPVHTKVRIVHTKWVVLYYPTPTMAMMAKMSTRAFEKYFFDLTTAVDYVKMSELMDPALEFLNQAEQVTIQGPGTELEFSIKGIGSVKSFGRRNIPDGEIFTSPVKNSVNGTISYNVPSTYKNQGFTFTDVKLHFEQGRIVDARANDSERINQLLDTDEGARYVGEFAMGCNPFITFPMDNALFDEKIAGSFHFTPGNAYEQADNGNRSAVHWDLVCIQTPEYGGGEIRIDDMLVRKDGRFVHKDFLGLNPENLVRR